MYKSIANLKLYFIFNSDYWSLNSKIFNKLFNKTLLIVLYTIITIQYFINDIYFKIWERMYIYVCLLQLRMVGNR